MMTQYKSRLAQKHHQLREHPILKYPYKIILITVGFAVLLAGVAMLVLPGPGIATILVGMGILSLELSLFATWLKKLKAHFCSLKRRVIVHLARKRRYKETKKKVVSTPVRNDVYVH